MKRLPVYVVAVIVLLGVGIWLVWPALNYLRTLNNERDSLSSMEKSLMGKWVKYYLAEPNSGNTFLYFFNDHSVVLCNPITGREEYGHFKIIPGDSRELEEKEWYLETEDSKGNTNIYLLIYTEGHGVAMDQIRLHQLGNDPERDSDYAVYKKLIKGWYIK